MASTRVAAVLLVAVAAMAVASVVFVYGLFGFRTVDSVGKVSGIGVGVYKEAACINNVTEIDWGFMEPGASRGYTVYIRNEGNLPMTLNMTVNEWIPASATTYMTLSWNVEGNHVNPQAVVQAVLTLSVSPSVSGITDFSFEITIMGIE